MASNRMVRSIILPGERRLEIVHGDLLDELVEAIVNPANNQLHHGGGVAGAIARQGGPQVQEESNAWVRANGVVSHAGPAYTSAGRLPFRYIIHAVGPVWGEGEEDQKLNDAVAGSLMTASTLGLRSLSMPAISTGIFGFPMQRAARIILQAIAHYFSANPESSLQEVHVVLFDQTALGVFLDVLDEN